MDINKDFEMSRLSFDIGDMTVTVLKNSSLGQMNINDRCDPHFHTHFEFQYIKSGQVALEGDSTMHIAKQDDFIIIPPGTFHNSEANNEFSRFTLMFSIMQNGKNENDFSEYCHYSRILDSVNGITVLKDSKVSDGFKKVIDKGLNTTPVNLHIIKLNLSMLFISIMQGIEKNSTVCSAAENSTNGVKWSHENEQMKFIIENYIIKNFADSNASEEIAKALNMSSRNCSRVVKNLLGKSISELVTQQRMHIAKSLITKTDRQLGDIAEAVGYKTYVAFFTAFKKYYGISPNILRQ